MAGGSGGALELACVRALLLAFCFPCASRHLATLLGAGSGGPEAQQQPQSIGALIKRRGAAAAPVAAAPAAALTPALLSSTHLVDLLGSLVQGGFVGSADAQTLAHGLLTGEGGDAALIGAVSDAVSQWRATGEFDRFKAEVARLGSLQRLRLQQQKQQQQQQHSSVATAAPRAAAIDAAAPGGGRTDEALLFERTCRARDEARAAFAQAALKAKTASAPPHQVPHLSPGVLPPSALVEVVARLSAGGLLSPGASKALAAGIPRTPQLAAAVMCAVSAAARGGNLSMMVAELERLGSGNIASSSVPTSPPAPDAGSSRPRRAPVALTPFKSLPPDDDEEGSDGGDEEEWETAGGGWLGAAAAAKKRAWRSPSAAPAVASTSVSLLLKVIDELSKGMLLASPDAAALRTAVASDPGGELACAAAHAVGAFNSEGGAGGDVRALLAALEHACDAHCASSAAPTFLGTPETAAAAAAAAAGRTKGPEVAEAAAAAAESSLADLQAVISSLAGAGLIDAQDAVEVSWAGSELHLLLVQHTHPLARSPLCRYAQSSTRTTALPSLLSSQPSVCSRK